VRADAALADRHASVREAARAWRAAGILDDAGLTEVEALLPDDRVRVGPVFRVLLFLFTLIAVLAAGGFVFALIGSVAHVHSWPPFAIVSLLFGLLALVLTEVQTGSMKRAQGGTEAATSLATLCLLLGSAGIWLFGVLDLDPEPSMAFFMTLVAVACFAAAWRWGYPIYGAFSALAFLAAFAFLPLATGTPTAIHLVPAVRVAWIVLALAGIALLPRAMDSPRLPPAQRHIATATLLVLLVGLYTAVDISSFSGYWIEAFSLLRFSGSPPPPPSAPLRYTAMAATALVPGLLIAWGLVARRRPVLILGMLLAGCAAVSLRRFIHVAPLWVILSVSGGLLIALALLVRRFLDRGEGHERSGLTAEPPLEGKERARLLELIAATAAFTPAARDLPSEPAYHGKGGEFGGGGSNSEF
jgi:hypothetical protein